MSTNPNILKQVHQYVWYGTCEEELCDSENFDEWGDKANLVENAVVEISTYKDGVLHAYRPKYNLQSDVADNGIPILKNFECGHMYSITLKQGAEIEMQNMYPSNNLSTQMKYGVSSTCSALGEIGLSCTPEGYTAFYYRDQVTTLEDADPETNDIREPIRRFDINMFENEEGNLELCTTEDGYSDDVCRYYATFMWNRGGTRDQNAYFSLDLSKLRPQPSSNDDSGATELLCKLGTGTKDERLIGYLTIATLPLEETSMYIYENGNCYKAEIPTSTTATSLGIIDLEFSNIWSSSSMCTYSDPENTENPVVFDAFEVTPDTDLNSGNIQLTGFNLSGDLKLPPADTSELSNESVTINLKYYTKPDETIGIIKYFKCKPNENAPYVYLYARTGIFANTCLFGVISGDSCILGE